MPDIWQSIVTAAQAMSWLEVVATVFSAACVFLAVKRKVINYPIGIVGTIAFFFVFWNIGLYSSAMLQVFFTAVQVYGWWFWLRGDKGSKPQITRVDRKWIIGGLVAAGAGALGLSLITGAVGAKMALADAVIFGLSVVAQFFLDRKKLENWTVWIAVNVMSIYVYGTQGLALTTLLYVVFLFNAFYGYWEWNKEYRGYTKAKVAPKPVPNMATSDMVADVIDSKPFIYPGPSWVETKVETVAPVAPAPKPRATRKAAVKPQSAVPAKARSPRKPKATES